MTRGRAGKKKGKKVVNQGAVGDQVAPAEPGLSVMLQFSQRLAAFELYLKQNDRPKTGEQMMHLGHLLHAHACSEKKPFACPPICLYLSTHTHFDLYGSYCSEMRTLMEHMRTCPKMINCEFEKCSNSRVLMNHWRKCPITGCSMCSLLPYTRNEDQKIRVIEKDEAEKMAKKEKEAKEDKVKLVQNTVLVKYFGKFITLTSNMAHVQDFAKKILEISRFLQLCKDEDKWDTIINWLISILHTQQCRHDPASTTGCPVDFPPCAEVKNTLEHMDSCANYKDCAFENCMYSRLLIYHYCDPATCYLCGEWENMEKRCAEMGKKSDNGEKDVSDLSEALSSTNI